MRKLENTLKVTINNSTFTAYVYNWEIRETREMQFHEERDGVSRHLATIDLGTMEYTYQIYDSWYVDSKMEAITIDAFLKVTFPELFPVAA